MSSCAGGSESEASPVYRASSRLARATQRNCVWKGRGWGGKEDSVLWRGLGVPALGSSSVTAQGQTEPSNTYSFLSSARTNSRMAVLTGTQESEEKA